MPCLDGSLTAGDIRIDWVVRVGPPAGGGSVSGCPGLWSAVIGRGGSASHVRAHKAVLCIFVAIVFFCYHVVEVESHYSPFHLALTS